MEHRCVSRFQQAFQVIGIVWCQGDTDAGRNHQLVTIDFHWLQQCIQQALGDHAHRIGALDLVEHHGKFVPTEPRHIDARVRVDKMGYDVTVANTAGETVRDFPQQHVAGAVAQ